MQLQFISFWVEETNTIANSTIYGLSKTCSSAWVRPHNSIDQSQMLRNLIWLQPNQVFRYQHVMRLSGLDILTMTTTCFCHGSVLLQCELHVGCHYVWKKTTQCVVWQRCNLSFAPIYIWMMKTMNECIMMYWARPWHLSSIATLPFQMCV